MRPTLQPLLLIAILAAALLLPADAVRAQDADPEMASYYDQTSLLGAPPSVFREGLLGAANPALPAVIDNQFVVSWATQDGEFGSVGDWAVLGTAGGLGAGVIRRNAGPVESTGYHLSLAGGGKAGGFGIGYQRFTGDATALGRYDRLTVGTVLRPTRYLSLGVTGNVSLENDEREVVGALGVRPLGTSQLTVFADAAWGEGEAIRDVPWSVGANVEVVRGVDLVGRLFDTDAYSAGIRVELGRLGLDGQSRVDADGDFDEQVHRLRLGAPAPSAIADALQDGKRHVEARIEQVRYQEPRFPFGDDTPRFYELVRMLDRAGRSDRVSAVALDLSALQVGPEQAWELREAILRARGSGTTVVAFLDGGGMTTMHLASAADRVVLDPQATLQLPGYALSRTFLAGTLDKLGLGFQEWRFFEYKSAAEALSRTEFSEADSLQRQQFVNDQYALTTSEIATARPIEPDTLDRIIDERIVLTATEARQAGLVDTLARWNDREDLLEEATGEATRSMDLDHLAGVATATRRWGQPPRIAVVYGIGATQLDSGINATELRKQISDLAEDDGVAAVVFRVDSPGGSGMASDQVAEAIRKVAEAKPVIVSQGQVAASGGYWISAYADSILAGPNTVTGSIGVIGGWVYDDGFGDKTGLSSDVVKRGERADLFTGLRLPLVGATLPTRPLTDDEIGRVRDVFMQLYDDFVQVVAEGRDTTEAHVRSIGEGRIYSGRAGVDAGLVDEIGGLAEAVVMARSAAGLSDEAVDITEVNPESSVFGFGPFGAGGILETAARRLLPVGRSDREAESPAVDYVRTVLDHQPQPLVLLPPGYYPSAEVRMGNAE